MGTSSESLNTHNVLGLSSNGGIMKHHQFILITLCICLLSLNFCEGKDLNFPFSIKKITPGPIAMSLGGASICNISDPLVAVQNPANLVLKSQTQWTLSVYHAVHKEIVDSKNSTFDGISNANDKEWGLNYLGLNVPFRVFATRMAAALSWYPKFSFERSIKISQNDENQISSFRTWHVEQSGYMSALTLSYGIEILPQLSMGVNYNLWLDSLGDNQWEQTVSMHGIRPNGTNNPIQEFEQGNIKYEDSGSNFEMGLLWQVSSYLHAGATFQTPRSNLITTHINHNRSGNETYSTELSTPMSFGIGVSYLLKKNWKFFLDVRQVHWENLEFSTSQETTEVLTGQNSDTNNDLSVHMVHFGSDYNSNQKIGQFNTVYRVGLSLCTDRGIVHPEPDTTIGFGLGLIGKRMRFDFGYQYQRFLDREQTIISDAVMINYIRGHMLSVALSYRFNPN